MAIFYVNNTVVREIKDQEERSKSVLYTVYTHCTWSWSTLSRSRARALSSKYFRVSALCFGTFRSWLFGVLTYFKTSFNWKMNLFSTFVCMWAVHAESRLCSVSSQMLIQEPISNPSGKSCCLLNKGVVFALSAPWNTSLSFWHLYFWQSVQKSLANMVSLGKLL